MHNDAGGSKLTKPFLVAIASNTGALTSFPSSLAGLLWRRILSEKGRYHISTGRSRVLTRLRHRHPNKPTCIHDHQFSTRFSHYLRGTRNSSGRGSILVKWSRPNEAMSCLACKVENTVKTMLYFVIIGLRGRNPSKVHVLLPQANSSIINY